MYKDDRIEITARIERADVIRRMEIYAGRDGEINPWKSIIIQAVLVLACAAGAVLCLLTDSGRMAFSLGAITLVYAPLVILRAISVPRVRRQKQAQYEAEKNASEPDDEDNVLSCWFGRECLILRHPLWDEAVPYATFDRIVEYSDGLYFEREISGASDTVSIQSIFIPARFLSAHTASEIISRVNAVSKRYTCVTPLRPADPPQTETAPDDLFDLSDHKLLYEAEYSLTQEEVETATGRKMCLLAAGKRIKTAVWLILLITAIVAFPAVLMFSFGDVVEGSMMAVIAVIVEILMFWAVYHAIFTSVAKTQRKLLQAEVEYGSRVALYEDLACVRMYGDDTLVLYNWLIDIFRTPEFVCIRNISQTDSGSVPKNFHAIPVRALDDPDEFVRILEERIQAAKEGRIEPVGSSSFLTENLTETPPLRKDCFKGKNILTARYMDMDICLRRRFGVTELIINGDVYAEKRELIQGPYGLNAVVDGVVFDAVQHSDGKVQIFAQCLEIASGLHKI